jgi:dolichyl-phosphate beta-glucosyltransferase
LSTFLSVIIPAHNEENRLPDTLEQVIRFLEGESFTYEIIIVENGSTDKTFDVAQEFAREHKNAHVIQSERGKGAAVKRGMLEAQGEYRFMCDADLRCLWRDRRLSRLCSRGFDIAIASREAKELYATRTGISSSWCSVSTLSFKP